MVKYIPLILLGVLLNAAAQLVLKQGMRQIGFFEFKLENFCRIFSSVALNPYILLGLVFYVISVGVWLLVLSRVEVSFAYPLLSVGYIVTAFSSYLFFNESVTPTRWLGIAIICLGVYFVTKSAH
jgi:multidrug transporter EmrE-like cation transporter